MCDRKSFAKIRDAVIELQKADAVLAPIFGELGERGFNAVTTAASNTVAC